MKLKDNKPYAYILVTILVALGVGFALSENSEPCCSDATITAVSIDDNVSNSNLESVISIELYHFHGTKQCYSCIRLGELAEKTANTYYSDELDSGQLIFDHINYDLPENKDLKDKFGVTGSSLWIGTTIDGDFHKEQNTNVWYKIENEADYLSYLKGILDKRFVGDLN